MTPMPDRLAAALSDRYRLERELGAGGMVAARHHLEQASETPDRPPCILSG